MFNYAIEVKVSDNELRERKSCVEKCPIVDLMVLWYIIHFTTFLTQGRVA